MSPYIASLFSMLLLLAMSSCKQEPAQAPVQPAPPSPTDQNSVAQTTDPKPSPPVATATKPTQKAGPPVTTPTVAGPPKAPATRAEPAEAEIVQFRKGLMDRQANESELLELLGQYPQLAQVTVDGKFHALFAAAIGGHTKLIDVLIDMGLDPNTRTGSGNRSTTLWVALYNGNFETAKRLVERGADVNLRKLGFAGPDMRGQAAIHLAANTAPMEYLEFLISKGADVNRVDLEKKRTPLDYAIRKKKQEKIDYLRSKGAKTYEELVAAGVKIE